MADPCQESTPSWIPSTANTGHFPDNFYSPSLADRSRKLKGRTPRDARPETPNSTPASNSPAGEHALALRSGDGNSKM